MRDRLTSWLMLLALLAASYILSHLIGAAAIYTTILFCGDASAWSYLWGQYYSMGFVFFYTLYILLLLIYLTHYRRLAGPNPVLPDEELPSVTVVIPAYNEEERIGRTIENVLGQDYPRGKLEVLVVDDGSTDGTVGVASTFPVVVVRHPVNRGRGAAVMTGIRNAHGDIVVTMMRTRCLRGIVLEGWPQSSRLTHGLGLPVGGLGLLGPEAS